MSGFETSGRQAWEESERQDRDYVYGVLERELDGRLGKDPTLRKVFEAALEHLAEVAGDDDVVEDLGEGDEDDDEGEEEEGDEP